MQNAQMKSEPVAQANQLCMKIQLDMVESSIIYDALKAHVSNMKFTISELQDKGQSVVEETVELKLCEQLFTEFGDLYHTEIEDQYVVIEGDVVPKNILATLKLIENF